jgi:hypothetical protein
MHFLKLKLNTMTKRLAHFVSLLMHIKRISIVMGLTTVLLLSGSVQILAASDYDQQKTVTGRITDNSGVALAGVNVLEKNTTNGVTADADGKYTISVASPNSVLVFSFIG